MASASRGLFAIGLLLTGWLAGCGSSSPVANSASTGGGGGNTVNDGANTFMAIVPPGSNGNSAGSVGGPAPGVPQDAYIYPANYRDQLDMYGDLAQAKSPLKSAPCVPPADISAHVAASDDACNYFKNAPLTLTDAEAVSTTTMTAADGKSVTIRRDGWGVPYVDGEDRESAQFGLGFAAAQDRLWLFDLLRSVGRGLASEKLGPSPTTFELDLEFASDSAYSEDEITKIANDAVAKLGEPLGSMFLSDTQNFVAGMNAYIAYLQTPAGASEIPPEYGTLGAGAGTQATFPPAPFTVNDIVANAVLIQSALGLGGGGEARNLNLLQKLDPSITGGTTVIPDAACKLWRDLRHANDPNTPVTASGTFATESPAVSDDSCPQTLPSGTAIWDVNSFQGHVLEATGSGTPITLPAGLTSPLNVLGKAAAVTASAASVPQPPLLAAANPAPQKFVMSDDPGASLRNYLNEHGLPLTTSNFIAVTSSETESGHPIMVAGPQTGYFAPQLLWEAAVVSHGNTPYELAARGISTVNLPYIVIGHGLDFAWSPTSASSDFTDTRVSKLCNTDGSPPSRDDANNDGFPDADGYLYKGQCVRLYRRVDSWTANPTGASLALGGSATPETVNRYVLRTHYGPVIGTATVNGEPVVISRQRSTFLADVDTAAPFALLTTTGMSMDQARFKKLFNSMTATFNWLYVDSKDIAYIQSGLYPIRHSNVPTDLPVWGDGNYEWAADENLPANFFTLYGGDAANGALPYPSRTVPVKQDDQGYYEWNGFLPLSSHIQDTNPASGFLANWNNSGAHGWWAADANGNYGPIHRVNALRERLLAFEASGRKFNLGNMVEIMADAAYTDLRGLDLLPLLDEIARTGSLTSDQQSALSLLDDWLADGSQQWIDGGTGLGAYRRDRDGDGFYDHRAAVVLMDAWYTHLMETVTSQLSQIEALGASTLVGRYDAPRAQGSAFEQGWFQHMVRMLRVALNKPGALPYRALRCAGSSDASVCRTAVLKALDDAIADLGGMSNQANWDGSQLTYQKSASCGTVEKCDAVEHTSFSFQPVPPIPWINRPTFQQAVEIRAPVPH